MNRIYDIDSFQRIADSLQRIYESNCEGLWSMDGAEPLPIHDFDMLRVINQRPEIICIPSSDISMAETEGLRQITKNLSDGVLHTEDDGEIPCSKELDNFLKSFPIKECGKNG